MMKATDMTKTSVLINGDKLLTDREEEFFNSMVQKRKKKAFQVSIYWVNVSLWG